MRSTRQGSCGILPGLNAARPSTSKTLYGSLAAWVGSSIASFAGSVSAASIQSQDSDCTPLLCKLKPAITAACAAYNNGASLGTGSVTVTADNTSTNVAVAWNAQTKVATFAWRGTQESQVDNVSPASVIQSAKGNRAGTSKALQSVCNCRDHDLIVHNVKVWEARATCTEMCFDQNISPF